MSVQRLAARPPAPALAARDCMSAPALSVRLDDPARRAAELMIARGFSGLPVDDDDGRPVGLVSEADFVFGAHEARKHRQDAWLRMISDGQALNPDYLDMLDRELGRVRQFMAAPVVSVEADAPLAEVVRLMAERRIRRVVVTRHGKLAGVVTRRDLLRVAAPGVREALPSVRADEAARLVALPAAALREAPAPTPPAQGDFTAKALQALVAAHDAGLDAMRRRAADEAKRQRDARVAELLQAPLAEAEWTRLIADARRLAAQGARQGAVLRFPAALCDDGGRAINAPDPDWPATLRGKAARLYLRWREELQPQGFRLAAQIVTFPDGLPGDVEMTLIWGD